MWIVDTRQILSFIPLFCFQELEKGCMGNKWVNNILAIQKLTIPKGQQKEIGIHLQKN